MLDYNINHVSARAINPRKRQNGMMICVACHVQETLASSVGATRNGCQFTVVRILAIMLLKDFRFCS